MQYRKYIIKNYFDFRALKANAPIKSKKVKDPEGIFFSLEPSQLQRVCSE